MGPFKCPDCGIWWAGFEHRCQPAKSASGPEWPGWIPPETVRSASSTVRCTCDDARSTSGSKPICWVHDVQVTYTVGQSE